MSNGGGVAEACRREDTFLEMSEGDWKLALLELGKGQILQREGD